MTLTISTILVAGLLIAGTSFVGDQRSQVVNSELEVIGQRLAADIATADRLVRMGEGTTQVRVDSRLPSRVAGSHYNVAVVASGGNASLRIDAPSIEQSVLVPISNTTTVAPGTITGGDVVIAYDGAANQLELDHE